MTWCCNKLLITPGDNHMDRKLMLKEFKDINRKLKKCSDNRTKRNNCHWTVVENSAPFIFSDNSFDLPNAARPIAYPEQLLDIFDDKYRYILEKTSF